MSNSKLKFSLMIDIDKARRAISLIQSEISNVQKSLGSDITLDVDVSEAESNLEDLDGKTVNVDGDASGVVASSSDAQGAIDEVPDEKETKFVGDGQPLLQTMSQITLALGGLSMLYGKVKSALGGYVSASYTQEKAELDIINAMRVKGTATEKNVDLVMKLASETQKLTTVGDEESMQLLTLATNMGLATDKMEEALQGSIGLATAFASAGLSRETAMKGIALAYEGEFTQLQRYIPALQSAKDETEKMVILQKAMADGFELSKAETESGSGAMIQYQNLVGDLREKVGDFINQALTPLIKVLTKIVGFLNDYPGLVKVLISVLGVLAVRIAYLTTKQIALNAAKAVGVALTGNWVSLVAAAAIGVGLYASSVVFAEEKQTNFNEAIDESNRGIENQEERFKRLTKEARAYADTLDYATAKKDLQNISESIDKLYASVGADRDSEIIYFPNDDADEFYNKLNDLEAKEAVLKQKIRDADVQATRDYFAEKERLQYEASLSGIELYQYKISQLQSEYDALGKLDAENVEAKLDLDRQMLVYKKQIADEEKRIKSEAQVAESIEEEKSKQALIDSLNTKKLEMVQYYANLQQLSAISYDKMKADFTKYLKEVKEAYGEDSQEYKTTRDELIQIQNATQMRMIQDKGTFISRINALDRDSNSKLLNQYENLMDELKRLYKEDSDEYEEYRNKINQLSSNEALSKFDEEDDGLEDKIKKIKKYYDLNHDWLVESGKTEVEIEEAKSKAILAVRVQQLQSSVAIGAKLMNAYQGQSKSLFSIGKGLSIAQATISGFEAAARAFKDYPFPFNVIVAATQGALVAAEISKIKNTKYIPKAEKGGLTGLLVGPSHANGGILIEAEGKEYITQGKRVDELGVGFFDFINYAPINKVKEALTGIQLPTMNIPAVPKVAYASGGVVSSGNSFINDLITEIRSLRQEFREKNMTVNNYISANEVIDKADSAKFNEKNEEGSIVRSRW